MTFFEFQKRFPTEIDETYVGGKPKKSNVHTERETNDAFNSLVSLAIAA